MSRGGGEPPAAAVHLDLDGAPQIYAAHGWPYAAVDDPLFTTGLAGALAAFREAGVVATLFVVAEDLREERKRALIAAAAADGHELASHSLTHRRLTALDRDEKRHEIAGSRAVIAAELDVEVRGFRAPGFRCDQECLELVAEAGYAYDSSCLAGRGESGAPADRPVPGSALAELPVPTRPPFALPFHPSYGLVLGERYFASGLARWRVSERPFVLLFHLTDFAEPLPAVRLAGWRQRLFTLSHLSAGEKRARCRAMLRRVSDLYRIVPTASLVELAAGAGGRAGSAP
jgi:peptidoglycan/xylan/chitin deacetylase (PgdA/CDA1 family)